MLAKAYHELKDRQRIVRKENTPKLKAILKRHKDEVYIFLTNNKQDSYEAFRYEMENHEYIINWEGDTDVLGCFGLNEKLLLGYDLYDAYNRARRDYMAEAIEKEWY